jgi:hypothetical protein
MSALVEKGLRMNTNILGLLAGGLTLALASPALAANVSVEIEGQTLQSAPVAATTAASLTKGSYTCSSSDSVLSALDSATAGDWDGTTYGPSVPERIHGESHPIASGQSSWAFYVNGRFVNGDSCSGVNLHDGDKVLWFWSGAYASSGYDEPVLLDAPATAVPGRPFTVSVKQADTTFDSTTYEGTTTLSPASGASVAGGAAAATTGADGAATVTVPAGPYTLVATKGNRAPSRIAGCATDGADGFCGTTKADGGSTATTTTTTPAPCVTSGDDGRCGSPDRQAAPGALTALAEGKTYKKGQGPRQIAGHVADDPSGIADVRVRITGNDHGRCRTYDAKREALVTLRRCGATRGTWFSVGDKADFLYLLPSKLGRGRWVVDLQVVDKAGNTTSLARGTSRVVFTVA